MKPQRTIKASDMVERMIIILHDNGFRAWDLNSDYDCGWGGSSNRTAKEYHNIKKKLDSLITILPPKGKKKIK